MFSRIFLFALTVSASAIPADIIFRRQQSLPLTSGAAFSAPGVATFNNFISQGKTVCGPLSCAGSTFGAAAGDISPDVGGTRGVCTVEPSNPTPASANCDGQSTISTYVAPNCPQSYCGPAPQCYTVTNQGTIGGVSNGGSNTGSITVQIIDVCPSEHAQNFCKTNTPPEQRCGSSSVNSLDIDQNAYQALAGVSWYSGIANLNIQIQPTPCP